MPKQIDYKRLLTLPALLRIAALIFNILAIIFVQMAENPYHAARSVITFDSIAIAGACFSAITLTVAVLPIELRDSLKWLRNELLIQCALIIVYIYGCVTMVVETIDCYRTLDNGCPRQLTATICGALAIIIYIVDAVFKLRDFRRKSRAERLAAIDTGDGKVDEPYVDEEKSVAATTADDVNSTKPNTTNTD